jgi:hypothetical protein
MLFNFKNKLKIDILNAPREHTDYIKGELHYIEESQFLKSDCDVIISFCDDVKINLKNSIQVKAPVGYDDESIYWFDPNNEIARIDFSDFQSQTTHLSISTQFNVHFFYIIVLYILSFKMLKFNGTFFHASAIKYQNRTILFPAWRHVGKTNLMLSFIKDGAELIADDGVILFDNGSFIPFSKRMNLLYFNFLEYPELVDKVSPQMRELKLFMDRVRKGDFEINDRSSTLFLKLIREKVPNNKVTEVKQIPKKYFVDVIIHLNKNMNADLNYLDIQKINKDKLAVKCAEITDFELSHFSLAYNISKIINDNIQVELLEKSKELFYSIFHSSLKNSKNLYELNFNKHLKSAEAKKAICEILKNN